MTSPIETPCVKVCVIEPESGLCIGCLRTREEIAAWSGFSPEARRDVMEELPTRAPRLTRRKGGARARRSQPTS